MPTSILPVPFRQTSLLRGLLWLALAATWPAGTIRPAAAGDWPTVAHDMQRTSYAPKAPAPPYRIRWVWCNGERIDPERLARAVKEAPALGLYATLPDAVTTRFMNHAQPMVQGGVAYIGSVEGELFAIEVAGGKTRWRAKASGPILHCVTIADGGGGVFVATARGLDRFDLDGKKLWTFQEPRRGNFRGCPASLGGIVLAGSTSGCFYGIDAQTGQAKWEYDAGGPIYQSPAAYQQTVYFGSENNMHFHALDAASGKPIWKNTEVKSQTYWHYWPVVAGKVGLVLFQTGVAGGDHGSGFQVVDKAPNDYQQAQEIYRAWIEKNPGKQSFYALRLADGKQPYVVPVGQAGFADDLTPPPIVRDDGTVCSYHYSQQGTFQANGKFNAYGSPMDFGILDCQTGYFRRTGPVGTGAYPAISRMDDWHQTTMGGQHLFGIQMLRGWGVTTVGADVRKNKELHWMAKEGGQGDWNRYSRRGMDGLLGVPSWHNFHWGGGVGPTIAGDVVLLNPFQGLYLIAYESGK